MLHILDRASRKEPVITRMGDVAKPRMQDSRLKFNEAVRNAGRANRLPIRSPFTDGARKGTP